MGKGHPRGPLEKGDPEKVEKGRPKRGQLEALRKYGPNAWWEQHWGDFETPEEDREERLRNWKEMGLERVKDTLKERLWRRGYYRVAWAVASVFCWSYWSEVSRMRPDVSLSSRPTG